MKRLTLFFLVIASLLIITACGQNKPTVSDAWVRPAPAGVPVSAAYMTIKGNDTLVGVSVPADVAEMAEVHKTTSVPAMSDDAMMGDKTMGMEPAGPVTVNGSLQLKPGGYHIMLMGVKKPLVVGGRVAVTLKFKEYGDLVVEAPVRDGA